MEHTIGYIKCYDSNSLLSSWRLRGRCTFSSSVNWHILILTVMYFFNIFLLHPGLVTESKCASSPTNHQSALKMFPTRD